MASHITPGAASYRTNPPIPAMVRFILAGRAWARTVGRDAAIAALREALRPVKTPFEVHVTRWVVNQPYSPRRGEPERMGHGMPCRHPLAQHDELCSERALELWPKKQGHPYGLTQTNFFGHSNLDVRAKTGLVLDADDVGDWDVFLTVVRELGLTASWHRSGGHRPNVPKWHGEIWFAEHVRAPERPLGVKVGSPQWKAWETDHYRWVNDVWKPGAGHLTGVFAELAGVQHGPRGAGFDPAVPDHVGGLVYPPHRRTATDAPQTGNGYQDTGYALGFFAALRATGYQAPSPRFTSTRQGASTVSPPPDSTDAEDDSLVRAFEAWGKLCRRRGAKALVECPWAHEHSSGTRGDSSTVILPGGRFHCSHAHCLGRRTRDVLAVMPETVRAVARPSVSDEAFQAKLDALFPPRSPADETAAYWERKAKDQREQAEEERDLALHRARTLPFDAKLTARAHHVRSVTEAHAAERDHYLGTGWKSESNPDGIEPHQAPTLVRIDGADRAYDFARGVLLPPLQAHYRELKVPRKARCGFHQGIYAPSINQLKAVHRGCRALDCPSCGPEVWAFQLAGALVGPVVEDGVRSPVPLCERRLYVYEFSASAYAGWKRAVQKTKAPWFAFHCRGTIVAFTTVALPTAKRGPTAASGGPRLELHCPDDIIDMAIAVQLRSIRWVPGLPGIEWIGAPPETFAETSFSPPMDGSAKVSGPSDYPDARDSDTEGTDWPQGLMFGALDSSQHLCVDPRVLVRDARAHGWVLEAPRVDPHRLRDAAIVRGLWVTGTTDAAGRALTVNAPATTEERHALLRDAGATVLSPNPVKAGTATRTLADPARSSDPVVETSALALLGSEHEAPTPTPDPLRSDVSAERDDAPPAHGVSPSVPDWADNDREDNPGLRRDLNDFDLWESATTGEHSPCASSDEALPECESTPREIMFQSVPTDWDAMFADLVGT